MELVKSLQLKIYRCPCPFFDSWLSQIARFVGFFRHQNMVSSQNGTHLRLISFKFGVKRKKKNMEATTYLFRFFDFIA